jgi:hypothetical protein
MNVERPQINVNEFNRVYNYDSIKAGPQHVAFSYAEFSDTVISYLDANLKTIATGTIKGIKCGNWVTTVLEDKNGLIVSVGNCLQGGSWLDYVAIFDPTMKANETNPSLHQK